MKLYKLRQDIIRGYDTYDSCVVCAENEEKARLIHPDEHYGWDYGWDWEYSTTWVSRDEVSKIEVTYLGEAKEGLKAGVIVSSFNAG